MHIEKAFVISLILLFSSTAESTEPLRTAEVCTVLTASADTYVSEATPTSNYGGEEVIFVGSPSPGSCLAGLIEFSVDEIPQGSAVNSVELRLCPAEPPLPEEPLGIVLRMLTASWSESNVTWNNSPCASEDPVVAGFCDQGDVPVWRWQSDDYPELIDLVQCWIDDGVNNIGIAVVCEADHPAISFCSREAGSEGFRPQLVVRFSPPRPSITSMHLSNDGDVVISWEAYPYVWYSIEHSADSENWVYAGRAFAETRGEIQWVDDGTMTGLPLSGVSARYYRISIGPDTLSGMPYIPGGEFEMGDHFDDGDWDELPLHEVYVSSFYMDSCEITNEEFCEYLNLALLGNEIEVHGAGYVYPAGGDGESPYFRTHEVSTGSDISYDGVTFSFEAGREDFPVCYVSWFGALAYCNWRSAQEGLDPCYDLTTWDCDFSTNGYRLPTEAEWEYAARGGQYGPYHKYWWGDDLDASKANYYMSGDPYDTRTPVGYYPPNGYGLYDTAGNLMEWCNDRYDGDYYEYSPHDNPHGAEAVSLFMPSPVVRGGDYGNYWGESGIRNAFRSYQAPDDMLGTFGFRCVRAAE